VTLTMWHMAFCSAAAAALVRLRYVPATEGVTREVRAITMSYSSTHKHQTLSAA
jgi:hypothetical protein